VARGPARTPTAQLVAKGATRASERAAAEASSLAQVGAPDLPAYLDKRAREEWARLLPLLTARKVLTATDGAVLGEHCQAAADVERYMGLIDEEGEVVETPNGALQRHPYTVLLREARRRLVDTAGRLGMTPADRTRATQANDPGVVKNAFSLLPGGKAAG